MSGAICGHERETLRWAIRACGDEPSEVDFFACDDEQRATLRAITSIAKLAAIIAEIMRGHGVDAIAYGRLAFEPDMGDQNDPVGSASAWAIVETSAARLLILSKSVRREITMSQARAFALALLEAPADTDIERMIGEVTHVVG